MNEAFSDIMGDGGGVLLPGRGQRPPEGRLPRRGGRDHSGRAPLDAEPRVARRTPTTTASATTGSEDNGGVHINSGIPDHAFYLAIEGGTHRLSRVTVQGVGAANREQIEKVFYRAFTFLLPPSADFRTARAATIQAARDLQGAGSPAERAIAQAWTAVGVE